MPNAQTRRHARNRRTFSPARPYLGTEAVVTAAEATDTETLVLTFDVNIQLSGIPQFPVDDTMPVGAVLSACNECTLTYPAGTLSGQTMVSIPQGDPSIRSRTGGHARPGNASFPDPAL